MNTKKTIAFFAIAMAVAFVASVGMASAATTLYADQDIPVGTVTVSADGTTITYTTTDGWVLNATHLHVATDLGAIPQTKKFNPIPGQFEYSTVHDPPVTVYTYTIPAPACTKLYIAAQAKVALLVEEAYVQEESAWAGTEVGQMPFLGKNWATYFTYEILTEILHLDNKDPITWQPITGDGISGILEYCPSGPTFDFVFGGEGLVADTDYSLIYYADGWPGNHPGALIGSGTSDGDGNIQMEGSTELGMDLPDPADANYPVGAKIWLVLSADYDGTNAMTDWNPTEYLYEHNLITYDDTDV